MRSIFPWNRHRHTSSLIIVTDPGPDPDDVKALLIAAILHNQRHILLRAVIANGGGCARARARLARRMLDHVGANDVPVGVGSDGTEVAAQPHEYKLQGCLEVPDNTLRDGGELLLDALSRAPDQTVSVVLISSLRDFADVCARAPALVRRKVCVVAVQGGLVPNTTAPAGWVPDTSVNNEFDREAAAAVYDFCFEHGLPMTVTSRHAVPVIPMQLARSFAERTDCPVMRYLADAQFLGLCCLWMRLCDDKLPARCTKQWFFATFCGVAEEEFASRELDRLGADADIVTYLDGVVKPYDVLALMTVLPQARGLFPADARFVHRGVEHLLLLEPAHAISAEPVVNLLRDVYHEVALATAGVAAEARRAAGGRLPLRAGLAGVRSEASEERLRSALGDSAAAADRAGDGDGAAPHAFATGLGTRADVALRTDLRSELRDDELIVRQLHRHAKVGPDELTDLLRESIAQATYVRNRLAWLALGCAVLVCALLICAVAGPLFALGVTPSLVWQGLLITASNVSYLIVAGTFGRKHCATAGREALICASLAALAILNGGVYMWLRRQRLLAAPLEWVLSESELVPPLVARSLPAGSDLARALGVAGTLLSYCSLAVFPGCALLVLGHAARGISWQARGHKDLPVGHARWSRAAPVSVARDRPPPPALSPAAFKRTLHAWLGLMSVWIIAFDGWLAVVTLAAPAATREPHVGLTLALIAASVALNALIGAFCASRAVERAVHASLGAPSHTSSARQSALISLAPLIGFDGKSTPYEPAALVADAARVFSVICLDARARELLRSGAVHAKAVALAGGISTHADERPGGEEVHVHRFGPAAARQYAMLVDDDLEEDATARAGTAGGGGGSEAADASAASNGGLALASRAGLVPRSTFDAAEAGAAGRRLHAVRAERADAFVARAPSDGLMPAELCAWAERFEAREGRPPTVWMRDISDDVSLSSSELVAHMLCYLARCEHIVLLASSRTPLSLLPVIICHVWSVLGGLPSHIDVVLSDSEPLEQIVAAFDTFHVMHASFDLPIPWATEDAVVDRLRDCVRLATVRAFNIVLRELLPSVYAAAETRRAKEFAAAVHAEGLNDGTTTAQVHARGSVPAQRPRQPLGGWR